jgi:SWI/SNF-related matrix-associated actin-dependent regulator 1 of chromatin subfamily A
MFDQDFNPHNDRQAQDRAYRIGQKRDVDVVKLITRGTVEEDMLRLGEMKLALDEAVAGDTEEGGAAKGMGKVEKEMTKSLMHTLRQKFENDQEETKVPKVQDLAKVDTIEDAGSPLTDAEMAN